MVIEELIELTNRINRLRDILEIAQNNDKLSITIKDTFENELKTVDIEDGYGYKERIINELDDIIAPLINQFHIINEYLLEQYKFDAAFLITIYSDCQSNDRFIDTIDDNYNNSGEVLTLYSKGQGI